MKAILDYTPTHCPNCGAALGLIGWALTDYRAGNPVACAGCGAELVYAPGQALHEFEMHQAAQAGDTSTPARCAACGNWLEPDESHPSKIYKGAICDGCLDLER